MARLEGEIGALEEEQKMRAALLGKPVQSSP
jgi:hypothetical protein